VFAAIAGRESRASTDGTTWSVRFGESTVVLDAAAVSHRAGVGDGIVGVSFRVDDIDDRVRRLDALQAVYEYRDGAVSIDPAWSSGIEVVIHTGDDEAEPGEQAEAVLDHVAVLVGEVDDSVRRWEGILGQAPDHLGPHPLGTSYAARFMFGSQMIEVVAAPPGQPDSPLRQRQERVGDGPLAVALVATDLERTVGRVRATGARIIDDPPHQFVHPRDAAGTLIQLTPRVHSEEDVAER
jgi:catechol 2,3-dioxygenase-like lactoylglutathione lyase family enzyme